MAAVLNLDGVQRQELFVCISRWAEDRTGCCCSSGNVLVNSSVLLFCSSAMGGSVAGRTYSNQASVYSPPPAAVDVAAYQNAGTNLSQVPNYSLVSTALPQPAGSQQAPPQQPQPLPPQQPQHSYSQKALL